METIRELPEFTDLEFTEDDRELFHLEDTDLKAKAI